MALPGAGSLPVQRRRRGSRLRVAVIGAGAFGGWTALHLRRGGAEVTLLDAWGPGNSRASSGGETRVIRTIYGATRRYIEMAARALTLWAEWDRTAQEQFYGFKMGPAFGEMLARLVREDGSPDSLFTLARLASAAR